MSLEWFSRLKEYDSLARARLGHLSAIKAQDDRIAGLDKRRTDSMAQLTNLKGDYVRLQQNLHEIEQKMKLLSTQKQNWIDQGGDEKKRISMETEISSLEDKGMELLETLDQNETERKDTQTFIDGIGKTIEEIRTEVMAEQKIHTEEISNIDLRLASLLEVLPSDFKDLLMRTLKKNLAHGPFTRTDSGTCFFCRFKISRMDEDEIDIQKKLKTCPQCSRIFIPYGT